MNLKREALIARQIEKIKHELAQLGDLRPGSLSTQYNVCGTPNCRCKADPPERHGPYYHLSYTWHMRSRSEFVRAQDLADVQAQLRTYARLRALVDEWIALGLERARLIRDERKSASTSPKKRPVTAISRRRRFVTRDS